MFWNAITDRKVTYEDVKSPRDPDTGIIMGAEPLTLGPQNADSAILLVHGFVGTPNNFNDLPQKLANLGWYVRAMLLPGHGTSPRDFENTTGEQLVRAVLEELSTLQAKFKTVVLLGHSLGGALATLVAAQTAVDGLILVSPYYAITYRWFYGLHPETWARLLAPFIRWIYRSENMQPVNYIEMRKNVLSYHWIPIRGAVTAIHLAEEARGESIAQHIKMPLLFIHSINDSVTDPKSAASVINAFPTRHKRILWLKSSDHIVFWDYEQTLVMEEVISFINNLQNFKEE